VRRVLRIASIAVLYQILSAGLYGPSVDASRNHISAGQTAGAIPEPAPTLQSQLQPILKAAKENDSKQFDTLINDLRIPDSADWFTSTFGKEIGERLAAAYSATWNDYKNNIESMFRESGAKNHTHVFVTKFSTSSISRRDPSIQSILGDARGPFVLYTARAGNNRASDVLPGVYVFVQGHFRAVNWRTFYDLPGFKPMRIRVDRRIAPEPTQHVDAVTPSDSQHPQVHGTVWVHVIIDRDGNVAEVEPVSGPPEFISDAVRSAWQWRFEPKRLKGEPVEVDTTIPITFVEATLKLE